MPYRSHYDRVFINDIIKQKKNYFINTRVKVNYFGTAYADNLFTLVIKVINYSIQIVLFHNIFFPYFQIILAVLFISILYVNTFYSIFLFIIYLLLRGIIIPLKKNKLIKVFVLKNFIPLFLIGTIIDISKILGFSLGIFTRLFKKKIRLDKFYK